MKMMKRISTMVIAAAMAATMAVGTAFSTSAANVIDNTGSVIADGGFYFNGAQAPYGMYDGNIDGDVYYEDGVVTFALQPTTFVTPHATVEGSISHLYDENGVDAIVDGVATLIVGDTYTLVVEGYHNFDVQFVLS